MDEFVTVLRAERTPVPYAPERVSHCGVSNWWSGSSICLPTANTEKTSRGTQGPGRLKNQPFCSNLTATFPPVQSGAEGGRGCFNCGFNTECFSSYRRGRVLKHGFPSRI